MQADPLAGAAIEVAGLCKRFRFPGIPKQATLKDLVVRRIRTEGRSSVVDALDDVTFSLGHGQTLGIIGRNGSGKTTLLRILSGIMRPDRGELHVNGVVAPLLSLGAGFHPYLSGRENAYIELLTLGLSRSEASALIPRVIEFSELTEFIDAPMRTYSSGMSMRLAFAVAICIDPDILLIDEILAVGDAIFANKCVAAMADFKRRGKTVALVTHDTELVTKTCDLALWLTNGRVAAYGEPATVVHQYHLTFAGAST
jgi:ABC-type polysaccharide/polyol phosphate transport system ATPase subunit